MSDPNASGGKLVVPALLADIVDDGLDLLTPYVQQAERMDRPEPLPSLVARCQAMVQDMQTDPGEPVRLIHHAACTGGTLICKWLAATPNSVLLSEIDPLSRLQITPGKWPFAPTDMLRLLQANPRSSDPDLIAKVFLGGLDALCTQLSATGQRLILRDHSHSHYFVGTKIEQRPSLLDIVQREHPVLSVMTVRHPLDSYLSVIKNKFVHFAPNTLEEYCQRYLQFLDAHQDMPRIKYEDFVDNPTEVYGQICKVLELPESRHVANVWPSFHLSGDSGRSGAAIKKRPRRELPLVLKRQLVNGASYSQLCRRLEYLEETS